MKRLLSLSCLLVAPALSAQQRINQTDDGLHFAEVGLALSLTLPEGWTVKSVSVATGRQWDFNLGGDEDLRLALRALPANVVDGPEALRDTIEAQASGEGYRDLTAFEAEVGGVACLGISVEVHAAEPKVFARQLYFEHGEHLFMLESYVSLTARERWTDEALHRLWSGLVLREPPAPDPGPDPVLQALAARCGSQIDWMPTWEAAAKKARAERKPILVHTRIYPGFALSDEVLVNSYTDPRIVALVQERYVAYQLRNYKDVPFADPDLYGLSGSTFGTSTILATPDGEVLAEDIGLLYPFLVRGLTLDADLPGPALIAPAEDGARAGAHLARGEHAEAAALIEHLEGLRAVALRGELALREGDLRAAIDHLATLPAEHPATVDRALAHLMLGERMEGLALMAAFRYAAPEDRRANEARYWLGAIHAEEDPGLSEALWRELAASSPDDPWAWRAAGTLLGTTFSLGEGIKLALPAPSQLAMAAPFVPGPLGVDQLEEATEGAIRFLLECQQPSGAWTHAGASVDDTDELRLAITSICGSGLMRYRERPEVAAALDRALAFVVAEHARMVERGDRTFFMDYTVWSRPYAVAFLADCVRSEVGEFDELAPTAARMLADIEGKQRSNGGWSYYMTNDVGGSGAGVPEHSISFTTAAAVLGLVRGTEGGFAVPAPVLNAALDCLEAMRDSVGNFEYFLWEGGARGGGNPEPGAAGRGPVCELALLRGHRLEDLDRIRRALDTFVRHRSGLMAEQGKALMHCGSSGQGSHYLTFDYAAAALALRTLPEGERVKYRDAILVAILAGRGATGGFLDNPMLGWAAGTGLSLQALQALK